MRLRLFIKISLKQIIVWSLVAVFAACATGKKGDIMLLDKHRLSVAAGETVAANSPDVVARYEKYFNKHDSIQLPLYKYVKSDEYEMFVGIPLNATLEQLDWYGAVADTTFAHTLTGSHLYRQFELEDLYVSQYALTTGGGNRTVIFAVTKSKPLSDSLFSEPMLAKRIY